MRQLLPDNLQPRKYLAKQFVRTVLGWYLGLAIVLTGSQLMIEFFNEKDNLSSQIRGLSQTFVPSLAESLWNYDEEQIAVTLSGMYSNPEVAGVYIEGANEAHYQIGTYLLGDGERIAVDRNGSAAEQGQVAKIYDVLYSESFPLMLPTDPSEHLGTLKVFYSSVTVIDRTYKTFIVTVVTALVKTTGLWFIAVYVFSRFVGRPVAKLQNDILEFDIESTSGPEYQPPDAAAMQQANELYILDQCFKALTAELVQKNAIVNAHTAELESLVKAKTEHLQAALQDVTQLSETKSEFLARMSHELRTPLNSIIGFTARIIKSEQDNLKERSLDALQMVKSNGEHLLAVINDLLDISKIEAGKMELNRQECELSMLVHETVASVKEQAQSKNLELTVVASANILAVVDSVRFRQIILNLLTNAIKYTERGGITVTMQEAIHSSKSGVEITIADTGEGIAEENFSKLFNRFEQLHYGTNAQSGTGLGLVITKELVTLFQGEINVKSELGKGTTFTVWIPLMAP